MSVLHRARILMAAALLGVALALLALPVDALAAVDEIDGRDHIFAGQDSGADGAVDVLVVSGADGETVYVQITQADGSVVASHLAYVLHDDDGTADEDGNIVGVVSVESSAGVSLDGAEVRVYGDRAQGQLLWKGTSSVVYAKLGDAARVPLALRTLGDDEERPFAAPRTIGRDGATYALAHDEPKVDDGHMTYEYAVSDETPSSVDGHIGYYDVRNPSAPIKVDTVAGIAWGTSREVRIPDIVSANGHDYRTMQLADRVTLAYPGATEYSVQCLEIAAAPTQGGLYKAKINYVGPDGSPLGVTDSVIVDRKYLYTPPSRLHVRGTDGRFVTYALSSSNDLGSGGAVVLEPGQASGERNIDLVYEPVPDTAERTWTVVLVNGSVSPDDPGREIRRVTYRGLPGTTATHPTDAAVEVDGKTLVPVAFSEASYDHVFGGADNQVEQVIYYVPDGWVAPEDYEVKVNYVDIATNGIISSETYTSSATARRDLEIGTPETLDADGREYVRLAGQELPIRHSYYAHNRAYNVYYRDVNDDLHSKVVIRTVRTEYIDSETGNTVRRTTTTRPGGSAAGDAETDASADAATGSARVTTPAAAPTATPAATPTRDTTGDAATATGIGTDEDVTAIVDDEVPLALVTDDGTDLATVRIEDNELPLARAPEGDGAPGHALPVVIGIGAGVAIAALVAAIVVRRRRRDDGTRA